MMEKTASATFSSLHQLQPLVRTIDYSLHSKLVTCRFGFSRYVYFVIVSRYIFLYKCTTKYFSSYLVNEVVLDKI
jgi:hypothetical protein